MMKFLLVSASFIVSSLFCSPALAAETETEGIVKMELKGQPGAWFPRDMYRAMLADIEHGKSLEVLVKELERDIDNGEKRLEVKDERILQLKEAVDLTVKAKDAAKEVVDNALRNERRAKEELDVWYRQPAFLLTAGAVGIVLVEVGAIVLISALDKK